MRKTKLSSNSACFLLLLLLLVSDLISTAMKHPNYSFKDQTLFVDKLPFLISNFYFGHRFLKTTHYVQVVFTYQYLKGYASIGVRGKQWIHLRITDNLLIHPYLFFLSLMFQYTYMYLILY